MQNVLTPAPIRPCPSRDELLERAEALVPVLAERARETERLRRIPDETVRDLREAGLVRLANPERFGGYGLDYDTVLEVTAVLGRGCGSTAWCYSVWSSHNWLLGMYPLPAQEEYFGESPDVLSSSSFAAGDRQLEPTQGGYLIRGTWSFSSGADAAQWVMIGANHPQQGPGLCVVPRSEYCIDDNWFVSGLKGTGSKNIVVDTPTFVPEHRFLSYASMTAADTPGRLLHERASYRVPLYAVLSYTLAWPIIGMADGAVREFERRLVGRASRDGRALADSASLQVLVAESATDVACAYALARQDLAEILDRGRREEPLSQLEVARTRSNQAYVARLALRATNRLFEVSGAHGLFETSAIQRFHRDVNAGSHQTALNWYANAEEYGRGRLAASRDGDPDGKSTRRAGGRVG
jgi:3-hydroxy-9,10-secoandrosta-1,3,5(10)-triene-9,17-dione monooxygenase